MRRWPVVVGSVTVLVAGAVVGGALLLPPGPVAEQAVPSPTVSPSPTATQSSAQRPPRMKVARATTLTARPTCDPVTGGFDPTTISIPGVTAAAAVTTPPRDDRGIPGTPPLSDAGKAVFAWDTAQGTRPGDPAGNVLLNAHTWPDGSALGNRMLAGLQTGDRIVVNGDGVRACYEVDERVEVLASEGLARYYTLDGPPQLAILACSGRRLGPGNWEKRTVWFASPV